MKKSFDMDGTLLNTGWMYEHAALEISNRYDLGLTQEEYRTRVGQGMTMTEYLTAVHHLNHDSVTEILRDRRNILTELFRESAEWMPHAERVLEQLRIQQGPVWIVTNAGQLAVDLLARKVKLYELIHKDHIICGDTPGVHRKPSGSGLLKMAKALQTSPASIEFVGDLPFDKKAADEASMPFVLIRNEYTPQEFDSYMGTTISCLSELLVTKKAA